MAKKVTLKTLEAHARLLGCYSLTFQAMLHARAAKEKGKRVLIRQHVSGFSVTVTDKSGESTTMRFG
jgi:hypothetical protein